MQLGFSTLIVLVLCASFSLGHDAMTSPTPRNPATSQTPDCGSGSAAIGPISTTVNAGDSLTVNWQGNHVNDGNVRIFLVSLQVNPPAGDLTNDGSSQLTYVPNTPATTTVTIPSGTASNNYTLVWEWITGAGAQWWSCSDIAVNGGAGGGIPPGASALGGNEFELANGHGTYNAETGTYTCDSGYNLVSDGNYKNCVGAFGGNMSDGAVVGIFIGALLLAIVFFGAVMLLFLRISRPDAYHRLVDNVKSKVGRS